MRFVLLVCSLSSVWAQNAMLDRSMDHIRHGIDDRGASMTIMRMLQWKLTAAMAEQFSCCATSALGPIRISSLAGYRVGRGFDPRNVIGSRPRIGAILNDGDEYQFFLYKKGGRRGFGTASKGSRIWFSMRPYIDFESGHGDGMRFEAHVNDFRIRGAALRAEGYSTYIFTLAYVK